MLNILSAANRFTSKGIQIGPMTDSQKAHSIYFAIIFSALIIWGIGVFVLYRTVGGPSLAMTDRLNVFGTKLFYRLELLAAIFVVIKCLEITTKTESESLLTYSLSVLKNDPFLILRLFAFSMLGVISFLYLQTNFMSVKTAIPVIQPFHFDDMARKIDNILFFGHDPWRVFAWIYDAPKLLSLIDKTYTLWILLISGAWVYAFASTKIPHQRRFQYILSTTLVWFVAGNILAILLSSAGPCYYHIFGSDPTYYNDLMASLNRVHSTVEINAFSYQDVLLAMYNNPETRFGGISAAPSLHVATSLLLLLFFWENLIARACLIIFNIIIYVGSIVLAWHYAIDGLISLPVVLLCWWFAGHISRKIEEKTQSHV